MIFNSDILKQLSNKSSIVLLRLTLNGHQNREFDYDKFDRQHYNALFLTNKKELEETNRQDFS